MRGRSPESGFAGLEPSVARHQFSRNMICSWAIAAPKSKI